MRSSLKHLLLFGCAMPTCTAVGVCQNSISISDFRYPETQAVDWKGGLSGSVRSNRGTYSSFLNSSPQQTSGNSSWGGASLNSTFLFFHSKDDHDQTLELTTYGTWNSSANDDDNVDGATSRRSESRSLSKRIRVDGSWQYLHYLQDGGIHFLGVGTGSYSGSYDRSNLWMQDSTFISTAERVSKSYTLSVSGFLGIGYGRMRDGTFVSRVLRIIERLQEDGAIPRQLSPQEMSGVIDRVASIREYTTNFERYKKYLVQDIVNELTAIEGVQITSFSALRILEAFDESIQPRLFGWRVFYRFGGDLSQRYYDVSESPERGGTDHDFERDRVFRHQVGMEFGQPLSLSTHVRSSLLVDIPGKDDADTHYNVRYDASATHEVTERIEGIITYEFARKTGTNSYLQPESYYSREISHYVAGTFRFFIEDAIFLSTPLNYENRSYDYYPAVSGERRSSHSSSFGFSFGINYNII